MPITVTDDSPIWMKLACITCEKILKSMEIIGSIGTKYIVPLRNQLLVSQDQKFKFTLVLLF